MLRSPTISQKVVLASVIGLSFFVVGLANLSSDNHEDRSRAPVYLVLGVGLLGFAYISISTSKRRLELENQKLHEAWLPAFKAVTAANEIAEERYRRERKKLETEVQAWNNFGHPLLELPQMLAARSALLAEARERVRSDLSIPEHEWRVILEDQTRMLTVVGISSFGNLAILDLGDFVGEQVWAEDEFPDNVRTYLAPTYSVTTAIVFDGGVSVHRSSFDLVNNAVHVSTYDRLRWDAVALISRRLGADGFHAAIVESTGGSAVEISLADGTSDFRSETELVTPSATGLAFMDRLQARSSQQRS